MNCVAVHNSTPTLSRDMVCGSLQKSALSPNQSHRD